MRATMRRMAAAVGAVLVLAGCEQTPTNTERESGEVRFTFTGDTAGSFVAEGAITRTNPQTGTYAVGAVETTATQARFLSVVGQRQGSVEGEVELLLISIDEPAVGSVTCTATTGDCPFGVLFAPGVAAGPTDPEGFFVSTVGTFQITVLTSRRAEGTFSLTLEELVREGEPRVIQVNGTFDVPLLSEWR
jgi:hypothetical protein